MSSEDKDRHQLGVTFAAFFVDGSKNGVSRFIPCFFFVALTLEFSFAKSHAIVAILKSANFIEYPGYMLSASAPNLLRDCLTT